MNNPPIRLTNDQFAALNRVIAIAQVGVDAQGWNHHKAAIDQALRVLAMCEVDPASFSLSEILHPGWDQKEAA